jgi:hypothetical protein
LQVVQAQIGESDLLLRLLAEHADLSADQFEPAVDDGALAALLRPLRVINSSMSV